MPYLEQSEVLSNSCFHALVFLGISLHKLQSLWLSVSLWSLLYCYRYLSVKTTPKMCCLPAQILRPESANTRAARYTTNRSLSRYRLVNISQTAWTVLKGVLSHIHVHLHIVLISWKHYHVSLVSCSPSKYNPLFVCSDSFMVSSDLRTAVEHTCLCFSY